MNDPSVDLFENEYCQCVVTHPDWSHFRCYKEAALKYNFKPNDSENTVRKRIQRLDAEPKILGRIAEIRLGLQRKNDAKWDANRENICDLLYEGIVRDAKDPDIRIHGCVKSIAMLADLKGWKNPQRVEVDATLSPGVGTSEVNAKLERLYRMLGIAPATPELTDESEIIDIKEDYETGEVQTAGVQDLPALRPGDEG